MSSILDAIYVFSRNWREFGTGHRDEEGAARLMGGPPPTLRERCNVRRVRVCARDIPAAAPTGPTNATHRSPMPAALAPLRLPGTSTLPVAHSAKRVPSRRGASARLAQCVPLEHRLVHQPIGRAALWRSPRKSIYIARDFCSLPPRIATACLLERTNERAGERAGDTIKYRNFHALAKRVSSFSSPPSAHPPLARDGNVTGKTLFVVDFSAKYVVSYLIFKEPEHWFSFLIFEEPSFNQLSLIS